MQDASAPNKGSLTSVFGAVAEGAKLREEHVIRRLVLRVILEHSPLEVLHCVGLPVQIASLLELIGNRIAELRQCSVLLPVFEEDPADSLTGLWEAYRVCRGIGLLGWRALGIFLLVLEYSKQ